MAWTTRERDALKEAIALGVRVVAYGDRRQEYRSLDEMKDILAMMEEELAPRKQRGDRRYASCSSGVRT